MTVSIADLLDLFTTITVVGMAIPRASLTTYFRARGQTFTAAVAYRSGLRIENLRTAEIFDYTHRLGVIYTELFNCGGMNEFELCNLVELREKHPRAWVGRELQIALPCELDADQRLEIARCYAMRLVSRYGVALHLAIHCPHTGDPRNHHAHIMMTTRMIEHQHSGMPKLGAKVRILDQISTSSHEVQWMRSEWEQIVNDALSKAGHTERIDMRSLIRRRLEPKSGITPVRKVTERPHSIPIAAWNLEKRGERSLITMLHRIFFRLSAWVRKHTIDQIKESHERNQATAKRRNHNSVRR